MRDPCAFSPGDRHARALSRSLAEMFDPGWVVIDLGFGQGHFLEAAAERGLVAIGIDRDEELVRSARERGLDARQADVRTLDTVLDGPVDAAVAAHLIEHLRPEEVGAMLASLAESVRPGGIFVMVTPNYADPRVGGEWFWNDPTHVRPYTPGTIGQLIDPGQWSLEAHGYERQFLTRETPKVLLNRLRFGSDYGRSGRWMRLRRVGRDQPSA